MTVSERTFDLAFLHERADDPTRALGETERAACEATRAAFVACDGVVARLGGRANRLGEGVVATALLEGFLLALAALGRAGVPVRLALDAPLHELFDAEGYAARHWPGIEVVALLASGPDEVAQRLIADMPCQRTLALDLHGGSDGMPALEVATRGKKRVTRLARLFRVGVRDYAARGPARRYAAFVEDTLGLPPASIDSLRAQPTLALAPADEARYPALAARYGLRPGAPLIVCCFQSVAPAKCYGRWDAVLQGVCAAFAERFPGAELDLLLACGPDAQNPPGAQLADLEAEFGGYTGVGGNARIRVARTEPLGELATLLRHATLALTNDTGPGHIAGALGTPTVTPYLPGAVYSMRVWASSLWHRGVTLDPNPYTRQQIEAAIAWDRTAIIDSIPPEALIAQALDALAVAYRAR